MDQELRALSWMFYKANGSVIIHNYLAIMGSVLNTGDQYVAMASQRLQMPSKPFSIVFGEGVNNERSLQNISIEIS